MKRRMNNLNRISNKGFTVVELVVVLILMTILLSLTIFGGLAWQDWTRFKSENSTAEEIFYAMQNQLTEYENGGATEQRVILPLQQGDGENKPNGFDSEYVLAYYSAATQDKEAVKWETDLNQIKDDKITGYSWDGIWATQNVVGSIIGTNTNSDKEDRTIIKLTAKAGDYSQKYLPYKAGNAVVGLNAGTILLFDLVSPYLADSSVLDGAVAVEFCPETGQVFSVLYSDRVKSGCGFLYGNSDTSGNIGVFDRTEDNRRDCQVGYFNVDKLSEKIEGRSVAQSDLKLEILNKEILYLKLTDNATGDDKLRSGDKLNFVLFNGSGNDVEGPGVLSFSLDFDEACTHTSFQDALANPMVVRVTCNNGLWQGMDGGVDFRIPVWVANANTNIYVLLDGADVQAGTSSFVAATEATDKNSDAAKAFRNTYSFYRFGLKGIVEYIHGSVTVSGSGRIDTEPVYSTGSLLSPSNPTGNAYHKDQAVDGHYGECVTFESVKDENDTTRNTEKTRTIKNARHFYNMRYETEYKGSTASNTKFLLTDNINWNSFIANSETEIGQGQEMNFFLNSFPGKQGSELDSAGYGVNYDGNSVATGGSGNRNEIASSSMADMKKFPFPGFRCLGKGDVFTREGDYTVSNLKISLAANILYGIYDDVLDGTRYGTENIKNQIKEDCYRGGAFAGLAGMKTVDYPTNPGVDLSTHANLARGGALPLGLFAENLGEISDIVLSDHTVVGIEKNLSVSGNASLLANDVDGILSTNMVGGFVGNNLGKIDKLKLTGTSSVCGRTDVGGILGRQSYYITAKDDNKAEVSITISEMYNEAMVTGYENVGGIVGRAYTHFVGETNQENDYCSSDYLYTEGNITLNTQRQNPRYSYYHDRYYITDQNLSMTGEKVARIEKINIENCQNRGIVTGDSAFAGKKVKNASNSSMDAKCAFIGGIAGITMDGFMLDIRTIRISNNLTPLTYYRNLGYANVSQEKTYVTMKNCNSYSDNTYHSVADLKNDYYKGDLVGYARLTTFVDCDNKPEGYDETTKPASEFFVTGKRYVGGLMGCSDACSYFTETEGGNAVTNYSNVIGERYVGGIAGGVGIGDSKQQTFSFWQPSCASVTGNTSQYEVNSNFEAYKGMANKAPWLNCGVVLGVKNSAASFADVTSTTNFNGCVGGITGFTRSPISNANNIQSDAVKAFAKQLIGAGDYDTAEGVQAIIAASAYGGNEVGGIVGRSGGFDWLNSSSGSTCRVDAIVFGENYVGGIIGHTYTKAGDKNNCVNNVYPEGSLILGRDAVGGLFGNYILPISTTGSFNRSLNNSYTVIGRYGVGGLFGILKPDGDCISLSVDENMSGTIRVKGIAYVGGVAGVKEKSIGIGAAGIHLRKTEVTAKYFAGALYGAEVANSLAEVTGKRVTADQTVKVNADAFAGGISGLFTHEAVVFNNNNGTFYKFANTIAGNSYDAAYSVAVLTAWPGGAATTVSFGDYAAGNSYSSNADVTAKLFAGGLFGFVPDHQSITITGFANGSTLKTTAAVSNVNESTDKNAKFSYLGGITGRIPRDMTVISCSNPVVRVNAGSSEAPDYRCNYHSDGGASYLGGLTEVNAGTIDSCGNSTSFVYTEFGGTVAPFAGVNGVLNLTADDKTNKSAAVIQNCTNGTANNTEIAQITSGGHAAGIAGATDGRSQITKCVNHGNITAMINTSAGTAAGIAAFSTNDGDAGHDEVHNFSECVNNGRIAGYSNAAGILALAADNPNPELSRVVNTITGCVNYGEISNKLGDTQNPDGNATGIAVSTAMGIIEYCRNYGTILGKDQMGITCSNTSRLYGNLVDNGFSELNSKHPLAPDDRPAEPNDESHIRNFYVSEAETYGSEKPDDLMTIQLAAGFWNVDEMIQNYEYYDSGGVDNYINTLLTTQVRNGYSWHIRSEIIYNRLGINASNPQPVWNYCLIKYFQPDETQAAEGKTNVDLFDAYTLILYGTFCRNNPGIVPDENNPDVVNQFCDYVTRVIATANLQPEDDEVTVEINISESAKSVELTQEGNPYKWDTHGIAQEFVSADSPYSDPELAYMYYLPADQGGFGNNHEAFGAYVNNAYRQFCHDGFNVTDETENKIRFIKYLKKLSKYAEIPTSIDDSEGGDKSHWPVQLYQRGSEGNYSLNYKRIELHNAGISDWDGTIPALDTKFLAMAKGSTPMNYSEEGQESQGFVKTPGGDGMVLDREVFNHGSIASRLLADAETARIKAEEEAKKKAEEEAKKKAEEEAKKKAEEEQQTDEPESDEPKSDEPEKDEPERDEPQVDDSESDEPEVDEPGRYEPAPSEPEIDDPENNEPQPENPADEPKPGESEKDETQNDQDSPDPKDPLNQPLQSRAAILGLNGTAGPKEKADDDAGKKQ